MKQHILLEQIVSIGRFTVVSRTLEMIKTSAFHLSNVNRR